MAYARSIRFDSISSRQAANHSFNYELDASTTTANSIQVVSDLGARGSGGLVVASGQLCAVLHVLPCPCLIAFGHTDRGVVPVLRNSATTSTSDGGGCAGTGSRRVFRHLSS